MSRTFNQLASAHGILLLCNHSTIFPLLLWIAFSQDLKLGEPAQESLYLSLQASCKAAYPTHLPLLTEHLTKVGGKGGMSRAVT